MQPTPSYTHLIRKHPAGKKILKNYLTN